MRSDDGSAIRWLRDILDHVDTAQGFVGGLSYEDFQADKLRRYAVVRCLEIISEASRRLPDEVKGRHPSISWRDIAAAGNFYRHEYGGVAARVIWRTLTHDLPILRGIVDAELARLRAD